MKWENLIRKNREKRAKNLGSFLNLDEHSPLDIWFIVASNVKHVKYRL